MNFLKWFSAKPKKSPMKISAVCVCVDYADFLAWSLPLNRSQFDELIIVTASHDKATQKLCEYWHVRCVISDDCYKDGALFNKAALINVGLKSLKNPSWVVHLDADIVLPPQFRHIINSIELDDECLYGVDRLDIDNFQDWLWHWYRPIVNNECNFSYSHLRGFRVGTRIVKFAEYHGWICIGFFQMWNQERKQLEYPADHTDAGRTDMLVNLNFERPKRQLLPELCVYHLSTKLAEGTPMGANWAGRRTPLFGSEVLGDFYRESDGKYPGVNH